MSIDLHVHLSLDVGDLLGISALAASIFLLTRTKKKVVPGISILLALLDLLIGFGILVLRIGQVPTLLILGIGFSALGGLMWLKEMSKPAVSAAAAIVLVGAVRMIQAFL